MVDSIGMFAGIRPLKNASEFGYSDYSPSMSQFDNKLNHIRNPAPGYFTPPSKDSKRNGIYYVSFHIIASPPTKRRT
jgi:hypothetical protein